MGFITLFSIVSIKRAPFRYHSVFKVLILVFDIGYVNKRLGIGDGYEL